MQSDQRNEHNPIRLSATDGNSDGGSSTEAVRLDQPIQFVKGVGPNRARLFARLGINTVADLIRHVPFRYESECGLMQMNEVPVDHIVTLRGEVASVRWHYRGRMPRFEASIEDGSGHIHLVWFHGGYLRKKIRPGMTLEVHGKTQRKYGYLQMINPKWARVDDDEGADGGGGYDPSLNKEARLRPVYSATEDLPSERIEQVIDSVLTEALAQIDDHLSAEACERLELVRLADAYRMIHRPACEEDHHKARRRLAFDELLMLQLGVAMRRHQWRIESTAHALDVTETVDRRIRDRLPFTLTPDQDAVISEVVADLEVATPMNRLLQGDVGSGKTAVALYAMLAAVADKHQAALLAPTELLAEQHYSTVCELLHDSGVRIGLLTGSLTAGERETIHADIREGRLDLVIGTHALLTDTVLFHRLAVLVIDEQHRFGVQQRAVLRQPKDGERKGTVPHTLVMTATPIPRTLSLTLFGDLDVSTIRKPPPGRSPVVTKVVTEVKRDTVYGYMADRMRKHGEQSYIVLPLIDEEAADGSPGEDEKLTSDLPTDEGEGESRTGLRNVRSHLKWLEDGPFAGLTLAAIHGRLKRQTRERIMERFRQGRIDALVATTVIEVGVDVANATMMVIENAERFGLAQLHQLRGRIGRGTDQKNKAVCTLIANPTTEDAQSRLDAIAETTDGFVIAERDFEIRGMGEIFGERQSGIAPLKSVTFPDDFDLLNLARREAFDRIKDDPDLHGAEHTLLRKRLMKLHGANLGIGDVG
ncbi:MAG: ATP-dependent DNA helicase RecG [Planctomycetes bacterium]|nr:ATP-dependent DNA helicase RecG [Planctomycetota bacterium]NOG55973.1 ATP-dependent DNA helicase RecG [Planctomycetota bacterium]